VVAEIFTLMSRDEARHAGFLNKAMSDFNLALDLGFLTKNRWGLGGWRGVWVGGVVVGGVAGLSHQEQVGGWVVFLNVAGTQPS
jgi:hypothetical protein